uniref:Uncharacterized protein n=1 Tax=Pipistrellus kuhlii TaxID=59472 RepID=A0A7J8A7S3_PIPKU|nr:hypothetical protein mPipKuh1_008850 [Pipistrellus kuhlii]
MQINPTKIVVNLHMLRKGGVKTEDSIEGKGRESRKQGSCGRERAGRTSSGQWQSVVWQWKGKCGVGGRDGKREGKAPSSSRRESSGGRGGSRESVAGRGRGQRGGGGRREAYWKPCSCRNLPAMSP